MRVDKRPFANRLIVEGNDDLHSVVGLMRHRIRWSAESKEWPVYIDVGRSVEEILEAGYLSAEIKASNVKILGVVLDADTNAAGRYQRIQQLLTALFPTLPASLPVGGLIVENLEGKRFGLWLMPDNESNGDLETFLRYLVPGRAEPLWKHACSSVETARSKGASCHSSHFTKANLYTWLAWQEPPGQSPGLALTQKILDPQAPSADNFAHWFKELYQLS